MIAGTNVVRRDRLTGTTDFKMENILLTGFDD